MKKGQRMSDRQKQKISNGMKRHHQRMSTAKKARRAERQSVAMRAYWSTVPNAQTIGSKLRKTLPILPENGSK